MGIGIRVGGSSMSCMIDFCTGGWSGDGTNGSGAGCEGRIAAGAKAATAGASCRGYNRINSFLILMITLIIAYS